MSGAIISPRLVSGWPSEIHFSPTSPRWGYSCVLSRPGFDMGTGSPNSGPHACAAATLPTKPSRQPLTKSLEDF